VDGAVDEEAEAEIGRSVGSEVEAAVFGSGLLAGTALVETGLHRPTEARANRQLAMVVRCIFGEGLSDYLSSP
jgi:hypothetical protein